MIIAICDDEVIYREIIGRHVQQWKTGCGEPTTELRYYERAEDVYDDWISGEYFDILFLDIQLPYMSGMDLARKLRQKDAQLPIVFITNYAQYAIEGYEANAYRYLVKPLKQKDVFACLDYAHARGNREDRYDFYLPCEDGNIHIYLQDVLCVTCDRHRAYFTMREAGVRHTIRMKGNFDDLLEKLAAPFLIRCHVSYLVNAMCVRSFTRSEIQMTNGDIVPISRSMQKDTMHRLLQISKGGKME